MSQRFSARIVKVGINPCVDVPARVSRALHKRGYIPVKGTIDGHPFRAGLVSLGGGRHRLFVNGEMRKAADVEAGDRVTVALDYDPEPRVLPMPRPLRNALDADPAAKLKWDALTPSSRKEMLAYLNSIKRAETIERLVVKIFAKHLR